MSYFLAAAASGFSGRLAGLKETRIRVLALLVATGLGLQGCASTGSISTKPEDAVRARAEEKGKAQMTKDLAQVYEFLSPASRQIISLEKFKATTRPGLWTAFEVRGVSCESEELCKASCSIKYTYPIAGKPGGFQGEADFEEVWKKEDGNWWYIPSPSR